MKTVGKPYKAGSIPFERRGVYITARPPTPEQKKAIERVERGIQGDWQGRNPYSVMRHAEEIGVEIYEEQKGEDGKWRREESPDAQMSLMQAGAL